MMNFLKLHCYLSVSLYRDFLTVSCLVFLNVKFISKQHIKSKQFRFKFPVSGSSAKQGQCNWLQSVTKYYGNFK